MEEVKNIKSVKNQAAEYLFMVNPNTKDGCKESRYGSY